MKIKIYECDDVLKEESGGDKYFIPYAEDTKLKTFRNKKEAKKWLKELEYGERKE